MVNGYYEYKGVYRVGSWIDDGAVDGGQFSNPLVKSCQDRSQDGTYLI